ncbi:hypothetical protein NM688_g9149 [Phlebia brevispora]|uniref:Uncharacterized protein n=1 Tax=Phlebia brevispora TaxID=194682 RepID=A0ACC1RKE1_9APHY|nr:hypothetical protein NM688_g9149 [Phlebia brevispora]
MLSLHGNRDKQFIDLSAELFDEIDWKAGTLRTLIHHLDIAAWAYEAVSGLLAIGTSKGVVDIYGNQSRGVERRVELSEPLRIRSLHFVSSLFRLAAVDEHNRLTIWDLNAPGKPKLQSIVSFRYPVNCVAVSASHSHIFVALSNGEVQTYDVQCSRLSPYKCPNMWTLYEEKVIASGMPSAAGPGAEFPVQLLIHPRDLNMLFVAYGGGIALTDLTQRNTLRAYEYTLPPGAPGGGGFHAQELLKHRRPEVTAIAVHPAGHVFAAGYADGSIAFWALEDEDKPLFSLTLDGQHDVHIVDADKLDRMLAKPKDESDEPREPIFKLAWSGFPNSTDPRGGSRSNNPSLPAIQSP